MRWQLRVDLGELLPDTVHEVELRLHVGVRGLGSRIAFHRERHGRRLIADRQLHRIHSRQHKRPLRAASPEDHPLDLLRIGIAKVPCEAVVAVDHIRQLVVAPSTASAASSSDVRLLFLLAASGFRRRTLTLDRFLLRRLRFRLPLGHRLVHVSGLQLLRLDRLLRHLALELANDLPVRAEERERDLRPGLLIVKQVVDDRTAWRIGAYVGTRAATATSLDAERWRRGEDGPRLVNLLDRELP